MYCKILSKVIKVAKRQHFNNLIKHSKNKSKSVWSAVKAETNNEASEDKIPLTMKNKSIRNYDDLVTFSMIILLMLLTPNRKRVEIHIYRYLVICTQCLTHHIYN